MIPRPNKACSRREARLKRALFYQLLIAQVESVVISDNNEQKPATCPECGAGKIMGMSCWEQLGGILAWEWHDPNLHAVHFLTVASYNLQHPAQFTDKAIEKLREFFIDHLDNETPVDLLRRRIAKTAAGKNKVLKDLPEQQMILRHWNMTIADVYLPDHPESAAERVRAWARSIKSEL